MQKSISNKSKEYRDMLLRDAENRRTLENDFKSRFNLRERKTRKKPPPRGGDESVQTSSDIDDENDSVYDAKTDDLSWGKKRKKRESNEASGKPKRKMRRQETHETDESEGEDEEDEQESEGEEVYPGSLCSNQESDADSVGMGDSISSTERRRNMEDSQRKQVRKRTDRKSTRLNSSHLA